VEPRSAEDGKGAPQRGHDRNWLVRSRYDASDHADGMGDKQPPAAFLGSGLRAAPSERSDAPAQRARSNSGNVAGIAGVGPAASTADSRHSRITASKASRLTLVHLGVVDEAGLFCYNLPIVTGSGWYTRKVAER